MPDKVANCEPQKLNTEDDEASGSYKEFQISNLHTKIFSGKSLKFHSKKTSAEVISPPTNEDLLDVKHKMPFSVSSSSKKRSYSAKMGFRQTNFSKNKLELSPEQANINVKLGSEKANDYNDDDQNYTHV